MAEPIRPIEGYLKNSIPDVITRCFLGYGHLPNLVPNACGIFVGCSIAGVPDADVIPSFQLSFGDVFSDKNGDLIFICANYNSSDPMHTLHNLVCLDKQTFVRWLSPKADTPAEKPQPNEWCIIPYANFIANKPDVPVTTGSIFNSLKDFQTACASFIQHIYDMKASKITAYSKVFFDEDVVVNESSDRGEDKSDDEDDFEADDNIDRNGNDDEDDASSNDNPTQGSAAKKQRTKKDPNAVGSRASSRKRGGNEEDESDNTGFRMPPAPAKRKAGSKTGKAKGSAKKTSKMQTPKTPKKTAEPKKSGTKNEGPNKKATPSNIGDHNANYMTPAANQRTTEKKVQSAEEESTFAAQMSRNKETLAYNGEVLCQALDFAERYNR